MKKLQGICVSGGIAIGSACLIRQAALSYSKESSLTQVAEKSRLNKAIADYTESTKAAAANLRTRVGDHDAAILEGHLLMLNDPVCAVKSMTCLQRVLPPSMPPPQFSRAISSSSPPQRMISPDSAPLM